MVSVQEKSTEGRGGQCRAGDVRMRVVHLGGWLKGVLEVSS